MRKKNNMFYKKENRFPKFKKFLGFQTIGLHCSPNQGQAVKKLKTRLIPITEK